jgi:transketolase
MAVGPGKTHNTMRTAVISERNEALSACRRLARQLRADAIRCTTAAGSGHPSSALSAADLAAVLLVQHLRYDPSDPHHPGNDRFVLSKGHAAPLLYAMLCAMGAISEDELMSLRRLDSRIEGHPTPRLPFVDAATGSLGQGLPIAVGIALAAKRLSGSGLRVWTLLGDGEMAEGSNYEALAAAAHHRLDNLVAIVDVNRLGQRGQTDLGWDVAAYRKRIEGFGWSAHPVDGHDCGEIDAAYQAAITSGRPACILARTVKGQGVGFIADHDGWHGRALTVDEARRALEEVDAGEREIVVPQRPSGGREPAPASRCAVALPVFQPGRRIATREACGEALKCLGDAWPDVIVLDAEVANSTHTDIFARHHPERFFELFIAEQLMVSVAQGLSIPSPRVVFCATFAAFLSRAVDQLRMATVSGAALRVCGSHAGISIGEDGPSQMGLEDIAIMRAFHGSTVLYPADATAAAALTIAMCACAGVSYLRLTRGATPVIYAAGEEFPLGGAKVLRSSADDRATILAAGITLHEALEAHRLLAEHGIAVRVIDLYSIKPIAVAAICAAARETPHLLVCEDHRAQGGIGEAVLAALAEGGTAAARFTHLAVRAMPTSGKPAEQLARHGISARDLVTAITAAAPSPPTG